MNDEQNLEQLKLELDGLEAEHSKLRKREVELNKALAETKKRMQELSGGFRGYGEISRKCDEIKTLQMRIDDKNKPHIIWTDGTVSKEEIVDKVTPKRIYVKRIGYTYKTQYDREGVAISRHFNDRQIDVRAMGLNE